MQNRWNWGLQIMGSIGNNKCTIAYVYKLCRGEHIGDQKAKSNSHNLSQGDAEVRLRAPMQSGGVRIRQGVAKDCNAFVEGWLR